jgi:alpha-galactosidase
MVPCLITGFDMLDGKTDFDQVRRYMQEWRQINPLFSGDYYPLTPFSRDDRHWIAWQFHRPDLGEGVIQSFRRATCPATAMRFPLRGLDPLAAYAVTDMDRPDKPVAMNGRMLMEEGLHVAIPADSQAVVIVYRKTGLSQIGFGV